MLYTVWFCWVFFDIANDLQMRLFFLMCAVVAISSVNECIRYHKDMNILQPTLFPQIHHDLLQLIINCRYWIHTLSTCWKQSGWLQVKLLLFLCQFRLITYSSPIWLCVKLVWKCMDMMNIVDWKCSCDLYPFDLSIWPSTCAFNSSSVKSHHVRASHLHL